MAMLGSRSFRIFTNHFAAVSFHAKNRGYATFKYYDWQFKRFYRIFVYTVFIIVVCEQNHETATRADFRCWSILLVHYTVSGVGQKNVNFNWSLMPESWLPFFIYQGMQLLNEANVPKWTQMENKAKIPNTKMAWHSYNFFPSITSICNHFGSDGPFSVSSSGRVTQFHLSCSHCFTWMLNG